MRRLEQTWRWYGPEDPVSLQDIKQAGSTGIVTALHHIPHGEIWPLDEIAKRKKIIEEAGFRWSVVESVPVHEAIKTRSEHVTHYIANYRQTLKNLAENGIKTVCYNFMPVLDWTRTQLDLELKDGSKALYFNWIDLAVFDLFMLKRKNAEADYTDSVRKESKERFENYTNEQLNQLQMNILMGIPGEKNIEIEELNKSIELYSTIGAEGLRQNLLYFLQSIADICEEYGISMTIHPDDPPYPILGLPRIAGNLEDFKYIIRGVDKKFNGICFCTGSLGAGKAELLAQMFSELKDRVYFIHLRNVQKDAHGNFYEADHLDGDVNMYEVMKVIAEENQKRETAIPFRPDHGHQMLDDLQKTTNPGYSAIGRLRGLAELRGLELGILGK